MINDIFKLEEVNVSYSGCEFIYELPGGGNRYQFNDKKCDGTVDVGDEVTFGDYQKKIYDQETIKSFEKKAGAFLAALPKGIERALQEMKSARLIVSCDNQDWCDSYPKDTVCDPTFLCKSDPDTYSADSSLCKDPADKRKFSYTSYFTWFDKLNGVKPVCNDGFAWIMPLCKDIKNAGQPKMGPCDGGGIWGSQQNWAGEISGLPIMDDTTVTVDIKSSAYDAPLASVLAVIGLFQPIFEEFKNKTTAAEKTLK